MKKSLVVTLALVFVLGIAGTAMAANPFTDVPANHWAYASVSKLAQAGVVEGFGDGRFIGNNNMTRYEMAQIVARAMAKMDSVDAATRAQIEKLAAEFADELDSLGVRVAKLEKNADNVKITGEARFAHYDYDKRLGGDNESTLRTRLWVTGQVNDRWNYVGMLENNGHNLETNTRAGDESKITLRRAYVDGSIGAVTVTAGAFNPVIMYGTLFDADMDGIRLGYASDKWSLDLYAGRPDGSNPYFSVLGAQNYTTYIANLGYAFSDSFNLGLAYYKVDGSLTDVFDANVFEVGVDYRFNKDFMAWAEYVRGDSPDGLDLDKSGWAAGVQFGETERNKAGSWKLWASYYDVPAMAAVAPTTELDINSWGDGFKGWTVGGSYMMAKNIDLNVEYYSFKNQDNYNTGKTTEKLLWTYVNFYF